jgi:hypothetical protein
MASSTVLQDVGSAFGCESFPDAMFYEFESALRFDLGGDIESTVPRFLRAFDRARAVVQSVLAASEELAVFAMHFGGADKRTRRDFQSFQSLQAMGASLAFSRPEKTFENDEGHIREFGYDLCRYWYRANVAKDVSIIDILVWAGVACEMPVTPKARWLIFYIVDFKRRLAIHIYDDRGMDIVAMDKATLKPFYVQFGDWLLDSDREQMTQVFS